MYHIVTDGGTAQLHTSQEWEYHSVFAGGLPLAHASAADIYLVEWLVILLLTSKLVCPLVVSVLLDEVAGPTA